jgi:malonyl-CoA O-methyltransferase
MIARGIIEKVKNDFSAAAGIYDSVSSIHKQIGCRILAGIRADNPEVILDIGMGTGYLTEQTAGKFPGSDVIGIDFAKGMVHYAASKRPNIKVVCADANELPFADNSIDLMISNLALQWTTDFDLLFNVCSRALKPGGQMLLSAFGRETFRELFFSLEHTANERKIIMPRLCGGEKIYGSARRYFGKIEYGCEKMLIRFDSMRHLLRWVKQLGANALGRGIFIGKGHMQRAEEYYQKQFPVQEECLDGKIYATLEIIWLDMKK